MRCYAVCMHDSRALIGGWELVRRDLICHHFTPVTNGLRILIHVAYRLAGTGSAAASSVYGQPTVARCGSTKEKEETGQNRPRRRGRYSLSGMQLGPRHTLLRSLRMLPLEHQKGVLQSALTFLEVLLGGRAYTWQSAHSLTHSLAHSLTRSLARSLAHSGVRGAYRVHQHDLLEDGHAQQQPRPRARVLGAMPLPSR
jgi:hypothetical protein